MPSHTSTELPISVSARIIKFLVFAQYIQYQYMLLFVNIANVYSFFSGIFALLVLTYNTLLWLTSWRILYIYISMKAQNSSFQLEHK